ncbi:alpha/beta hydrolase [Microbacterium flavescens]|uniref:alpha/beta hydrolase n=1 Tax=Microbacterium flavescens TaxID=69366 RepID=UPI001BDE9EDC|nr:alpha/beta hydrolase [Microbacterium flavescens]BFF10799.1 alpha/beta hydrolase [Microbacterium flavescens]
MFDGFAIEDVAVADDSVVHVRHGGSGPAVLLLHGHPRTGSTWHAVAPPLAEAGYSVVVPDLRGYGASRGPAPTPDHRAHSKRAVAGDMTRLMTLLGHERFTVVGHDRGSYVGLRLALDHAHRLDRAVLIDCLPISEHLARADARFATAWWHWFFFAQPETPERVINADPDAWYLGDPSVMGAENHAEWRAAMRNPDVVRAMLEDYRAGLTIDREDEEEDRRRGRRITVPLLVLWSLRDDLEQLYGDPLAIWRDWADSVSGAGVESGHHVAEEAPAALLDALLPFLREDRRVR